MNNPLARVFASFHCMAPLDQSRFFANVDFLTASDQTHHNTPFRDSFRKLDEMLRFGLRNGLVDVFFRDSILIPGPLGFVEDENVLGRNQVLPPRVFLNVILHVPDESFPVPSRSAELILQDLYKRTIPRQKYRRGCGFPICTGNCEVIQKMRMNQLETDQRLAGPGHTCKKDQTAGFCLRSFMHNAFQLGQCRFRGRVGTMDPAKFPRPHEFSGGMNQRGKRPVGIFRQKFAC
jgi:hypothetical protein